MEEHDEEPTEPTEKHNEEPKHKEERIPRKKNQEEQRRRKYQVNTGNQVLNTRFLRRFFSISDCHHIHDITRVLETQIPPLNLSFRVSRY